MEDRGKTQCIHFAERKRNRDRKTHASALEREAMRARGCIHPLYGCAKHVVSECMCVVCMHVNE